MSDTNLRESNMLESVRELKRALNYARDEIASVSGVEVRSEYAKQRVRQMVEDYWKLSRPDLVTFCTNAELEGLDKGLKELFRLVNARSLKKAYLVALKQLDQQVAELELKAMTSSVGSPRGSQAGDETKNTTLGGHARLSKKIFVVHGHDHGFKNTVARYLEALDLDVIILHERPDGGHTVIEKFEHESNVGFAVVLATADDVAQSVMGLEKSTDGISRDDLEARARQNVVFELGYFMGKLGRARTALVTDAGVNLPSDLSGIIYIHRNEWQKRLYDSLSEAGYHFTQAQTRAALAIF